jgi:NADPH:quinone reductase-like Zn-dependent oxidoreductase
MKAIGFYEHGGSEVLRYEDVPRPEPAPGEVLIAVGAVGVNRGPDVETRRKGFSMGELPKPHVGGTDPAGEIVELGDGVEDFAVGDRVAVYPVIACGVCDFCRAGAGENYCRDSRLFGVQTEGGRAEFTAAPATQVVRLPDSVSFAQAAALGVAYTTTYHGMFSRAEIGPGDSLLVMGAGGGVGVAAVQLAVDLGIPVFAVTGSDWKRERLLELGVEAAFSYRDGDWTEDLRAATEGGLGVTAAFDNGGTATLAASVSCMGRGGRLFCSGGTTGLEVGINVRNLYREQQSLLFYVQGAKADMEALVALVAAGRIDPVIDGAYPLAEAAAADDRMESGEHFGRIVITV